MDLYQNDLIKLPMRLLKGEYGMSENEEDANDSILNSYNYLKQVHFDWLNQLLAQNSSNQFEVMYTYLQSVTMTRDDFQAHIMEKIKQKFSQHNSEDSVNTALVYMSRYRQHEQFNVVSMGIQYA